jgi:hypothetical protein
MHKSALPNAIRETLSKSALNVKQETMPKSAKKEFVNREPNFFKGNSSVEFAKGYDVKSMKATVGFIDSKLKGGKSNYAVKDLQQQEHGGRIGGRSFKPTIYARAGKNSKGLVLPKFRISKIGKKLIDASKMHHLTDKQKFVVAAKLAKKGGYVLSKGMLWRIDQNPKIADSKGVTEINFKGQKVGYSHYTGLIERTPLYTFQKSGQAAVARTNFMREASMSTQKHMEAVFIKEAEKQIERNNKRK